MCGFFFVSGEMPFFCVCLSSVSLVNKAVVDYFFVDLGVERHFEALRHFLLMEDGEFAQSLSDLLFEKVGSARFYITFLISSNWRSTEW